MLACSSKKKSNLKNPFVGFASPFFFWLSGCENSPKKKEHCLRPIQGHKVQHLLVTWGQIENIFSYFSLDS
jgi:hypothetical protein